MIVIDRGGRDERASTACPCCNCVAYYRCGGEKSERPRLLCLVCGSEYGVSDSGVPMAWLEIQQPGTSAQQQKGTDGKADEAFQDPDAGPPTMARAA